MKILLIIPNGNIHKIKIGPYIRSMREAPLTLTTLASLVPKDLNIKFVLIDENVDSIPIQENFDLVGISVITGTAPRAYELAKHFKTKNIPVILGGVHVTIMPEEAIQYADYILTGQAEKLWPEFLKDFNNGTCKKIYHDTLNEKTLSNIPTPRRDLQKSWKYNISNTVYATRGCMQKCEFCSIPTVLPNYSKRPVSEVIDDIKSIKSKLFVFNDVSLTDDTEYSKELFSALIPLKKQWGGLSTTKIGNHPDLIELMAKSGCKYLLIGFESINKNNLKNMNKSINLYLSYKHIVDLLHSYDISIQGCFMFGSDDDDKTIFKKTVEYVLDLKIDIPRYSIITPYPGTVFFKKLKSQNRILTYNWENYDTMHVVFKPNLMSPTELYDGFKWSYNETFKLKHIMKRTAKFKFTSLINFIGNITYKGFIKQLYRNPRYKNPYILNDKNEYYKPEMQKRELMFTL